LREAFEETGLSNLVLESFLGEQERDMADFGLAEIHHRYFYHLRCQEQPPIRWRHEERFPSDNSGTHVFELFWVALPYDVPQLVADFDLMLPRLIERFGLAK
jgi:8-oxo-dGTP pyrophosphatase MutT (NUDIX family)